MRSCDGSTGIPEARLYRPPWAAASGTWQREASPGLDASRCPYLKTSVSRQKFILLARMRRGEQRSFSRGSIEKDFFII